MTASAATTRPKRKRSCVAMMLALVACIAAVLSVWRQNSESVVAVNMASILSSGSSADRAYALDRLWQIQAEPASVAVPSLFAALEDDDPQVRAQAAGLLSNVLLSVAQPVNSSYLHERLLSAIVHKDPVVRAWAARELAGVRGSAIATSSSATEAEAIVTALTKAASDPDTRVRIEALSALCELDPDSPATLHLLLAASENPEPSARQAAIMQINFRIASSGEACLAVVRALHDPSSTVRAAATKAKVSTGLVVPDEALPHLIQAFRDIQPRLVTRGGLHTPLAIPPNTFPQFAQVLEKSRARIQEHQEVESHVFQFLDIMGPTAQAAVPTLHEHLKQRAVDRERPWLVYTLGRVGQGTPEAQYWIPGLIDQAKTDPVSLEAQNAQFMLTAFRWDPKASEALREIAATIRKMRDDPASYNREATPR